jgi:hypothetical protein
MDYSSNTLEELLTIKETKEAAFESAKAELDEVADAIRQKQINAEFENKISQMTPEEIEILKSYVPGSLSVASINSEEEIGKL